MFHLMLDLETLSKRRDAAIVSIGITTFNEDGLLNSRLMLPQVQPQIDFGFHVQFDTLQWWMDQAAGAKRAAFQSEDETRLSWESILESFQSLGRFYIWGNGATFDVTILEHYFQRLGFLDQPPWDFRDVRDLRTLVSLCPDVPKIRSSSAHSALEDSKAQAEWAVACLRSLRQ